jgi:hypothetical protein
MRKLMRQPYLGGRGTPHHSLGTTWRLQSVPGPRGKSIFSAGFRELTDTRLGKEESAAADRML